VNTHVDAANYPWHKEFKRMGLEDVELLVHYARELEGRG